MHKLKMWYLVCSWPRSLSAHTNQYSHTHTHKHKKCDTNAKEKISQNPETFLLHTNVIPLSLFCFLKTMYKASKLVSLQRLIGGWTRNKLDCDISLHIGSPTNYMQNVVWLISYPNNILFSLKMQISQIL